ncbi:MAG: hypothetical protein WDZ93_00685 [Candidatus Paceibacterota bacterium]
MKRSPVRVLFILAAGAALTAGAFYAANAVTENEMLKAFVVNAHIFGAIVIAFISGLNFIVPVPPATFAPIFLEAGVSMYIVVAGFVIGTTLADSLGYFFGWVGKRYADSSYPAFTERLHDFLGEHHRLVLPVTFAYFAFAPLPNELILIPLALAGYRFRVLIIPMILGNIFHHSLLVFGYQSVFLWLF